MWVGVLPDFGKETAQGAPPHRGADMAPEARRMRPWLKDVLVFVGFTILDGLLMAAGYVALILTKSPPAVPMWLECWWWVFGAPVWLAVKAGCTAEWGWPIFWANPFVYGLLWWAIWKLAKLCWPKRAE